MDIPEYYKTIVMVTKENYFNLPYTDLKMQKKKKKYNPVTNVPRILNMTVVKEKKMDAWSADKGSTKLYICGDKEGLKQYLHKQIIQ